MCPMTDQCNSVDEISSCLFHNMFVVVHSFSPFCNFLLYVRWVGLRPDTMLTCMIQEGDQSRANNDAMIDETTEKDEAVI